MIFVRTFFIFFLAFIGTVWGEGMRSLDSPPGVVLSANVLNSNARSGVNFITISVTAEGGARRQDIPIEVKLSNGKEETSYDLPPIRITPGQSWQITYPIAITPNTSYTFHLEDSYVSLSSDDSPYYADPSPLPSGLARSPAVSADLTEKLIALTSPAGKTEQAEMVTLTNWPPAPSLMSSFRTVLITKKEYDALPQACQQALEYFTYTGGDLAILDTESGAPVCKRDNGAGFITTLGINKMTPDQAAEAIAPLAKPRLLNQIFPQVRHFSLEQAPSHILLVAVIILCFIILCFIILGPVTFLGLAAGSKKIRLFALVPLISFVSCIMIVAAILCSDGIGGKGYRRAHIYLHPTLNFAAIQQNQTCMIGFLLTSSFSLPAHTRITPVIDGDHHLDERPLYYQNGHQCSSGWFVNRKVSSHVLSSIQPSRAKITIISAPQEAPVIQSTLPYPVSNLYYKDEQDTIWIATQVTPGKKTPLSPTEDTPPVVLQKSTFYATCPSGAIATLSSITWDDHITISGQLAR